MDETDAKLAALNQEKLESGSWSKDQYDQAQAHLEASKLDATQLVTDAFYEGAGEGYDNMTGAAKEVLKSPFRLAWDIIPWQLWLLAAVALFFWMGGAALLKGRLAR
jgi:hypothetical protein